MGIFNTMMGGGGGTVTTFPDMVTIPEGYFKGAALYRISSTSSSSYGTPTYSYRLVVDEYITTEYNMSFPNATFVESDAFLGQTKASIYLPKITSISQLSSNAFYRAGILHLPNWSGSFPISSYASKCAGFIARNLSLHGATSSAVTGLKYLSCIGATSSTILTTASYICYAPLCSVTIYGITLVNLDTFGGGYVGALSSNLKYVNLPDATSVTSKGFIYVTGIRSLYLPNCTTIEPSAFSGVAIRTIEIPKLTSIKYSAFYKCYYLSSINCPSCTSVGDSAFYYCSNLGIVSIPKCTYIGWSAFYSCTSLSKLYLNQVTAVPSLMADAFYYTPMSGSTYLGYFGSIYVPKSLYNAFLTASNWSRYSARIVSV